MIYHLLKNPQNIEMVSSPRKDFYMSMVRAILPEIRTVTEQTSLTNIQK